MTGSAGGGGCGVDGCRGGWCYFRLHGTRYEYGVVDTLDELIERIPSDGPVLIDMPIGLTPGDPPVRVCDALARRTLGQRSSSVFSPPSRAALDCEDYWQASALNARLTGRKLSRQSWGLVPKIRELDRLLRERAELQRRFMECHPELCFFGLAGGRPMSHYKKTTAGFRERRAVLRALWPPAPQAIESACSSHPRQRVARDDFVDALALALAAALGRARLASLPDVAATDAVGLPMRIVYPRPLPA